jgi:hypothetical protein
MGQRGLTETVIPDGVYCYTRLGPMVSVDGGLPMMPVKVCPYWNSTEGGKNAYCEFMDMSDDVLLWDQVKICQVRDDFDLEDEIRGVMGDEPE